MSRGKPAPAIPMTERQNRLLSQHCAKHSVAHHHKTRIRLLLLANQGHTHAWIKRELGVDVNTVKRWRRRWEAEFDSITAFESGESGQGKSDKELLKRMLVVIKDNSRSGAPKQITLAQEKQIVALACEKPEDHGVALTQWNREMLAHVAKAKGIVEKISPRYVGEILKKNQASTS